MADNIRARVRKRFDLWVARRVPARDAVTLNRRIIYVLPTRNGLMFILASGLIFIGAINYAVSLAFGLAFMMVSLFILSILHCFNNLNQLQLSSQPCMPVYCGEDVAFNIVLSRALDRKHESLELCFPGGPLAHADLALLDREQVKVFTTARQRGYFKAPLLRVTTYFPLGLCRTWSVVNLDQYCLVYPKPIPFVMDAFAGGSGGEDDSAMAVAGSEDFYGLRDYVPGDSLRQVAWKSVARGQGMHVKQFVDYVDDKVWLDWDMFYGFGVEERLSRLCYCAQQLARSGKPYGLKIPGTEIAPASGTSHRNKVLKMLALYGQQE